MHHASLGSALTNNCKQVSPWGLSRSPSNGYYHHPSSYDYLRPSLARTSFLAKCTVALQKFRRSLPISLIYILSTSVRKVLAPLHFRFQADLPSKKNDAWFDVSVTSSNLLDKDVMVPSVDVLSRTVVANCGSYVYNNHMGSKGLWVVNAREVCILTQLKASENSA